MKIVSPFYALALVIVLAACSTTPPSGPSGGGGPHYKVGAPYQVDGHTYTPHEDYSYDETGIASWYGDAFHNGTTANGEVFNKNELTAAHKTLPLPTLARVTNLDNGRSIVVRINDRGPFSGARIIDVSQRAAQLLGFEGTGTAKVRVQVLADESKAIADAMRHYGSPAPVAVASAAPIEGGPSVEGVPEMLPNAAETPVNQAPLSPAAVETKELEPVRTTPAIHQQLVETKPVPEVFQLPVTGPTHIYVQAGAFTVLENATKLKATLSNLGPVSISDIVVNGQTFHRVRIGPVANVPQADAVLAKVRKAGEINAKTVVD